MTPENAPNGAYASHREAEERARFLPAAAVEEVQAVANTLEEYVRTLVREQPVVAVFTAAGVGYILARVFARGMR
jgi:ElaB/YqjD/DUF883 family membrane-anchored ribosome-binding protein